LERSDDWACRLAVALNKKAKTWDFISFRTPNLENTSMCSPFPGNENVNPAAEPPASTKKMFVSSVSLIYFHILGFPVLAR
jgi:hypothetical protein